MLHILTGQAPRRTVSPDAHAEAALHGAVWLDLLLPDDAERSLAERATGLRVPALADLSEIESSSRLSMQDGALYLSTPMSYLDAAKVSHIAPLGIVLSQQRLLTVRYAELPAFETYAARFQDAPERPSSVAAFAGLMEAVVDRLADVLEHVGADLDAMSRRVFRGEQTRVRRADLKLQAALRGVGQAGERLSNIRDSLLGLQRLVSYTCETVAAWIEEAERPRFAVLRQDIASLAEYDGRLSDKVQFLLDATLGFINIEQNNGIKVLTVVSVVGVPPTLLASIYGMNFKNMPELQWHYGYAYGLTMIVLSAVVPLLWFWRRGWV